MKEVDSRAKVQSPKTRNKNKPVKPKSHTQKPGRQIAIGQRLSPKKSSAVHEKPNTPVKPKSHTQKPGRQIAIGQRFSPKKSSAVHEKPNTLIAGLRWIPTRKMFTDNTTKVDSEPPNGLNDDKTNPYECDQTLNVSAGPTNLSAVQASLFNDKMTSVHISLGLALQRQMASADNTSGPDLVFCPMFDEYFNPSPSVVQPVLVAVVQEPVVSTGTHSSTRIDQDTPSTSTSQTTQEEQSHVTPTSVEEDDHGIEVAHMDNDL
ncbi:hypothetical protein Tco_1298504 [Tanacetum coccineum]